MGQYFVRDTKRFVDTRSAAYNYRVLGAECEASIARRVGAFSWLMPAHVRGAGPERPQSALRQQQAPLPGSRDIPALRYFVRASFRRKRSRPIRATTVISSDDDGRTDVAELIKRRCWASHTSLIIARRHCSTNSR